MIVVRPAVVGPVFQRGTALVRRGALRCARGAGMVLGQLGESGPAGVGVSLLLAAGLGALALRTIVFSEDGPALHGPSPAVAERAVRTPARPPLDRSNQQPAAPLPAKAIVFAGTAEQAERLRVAFAEADNIRGLQGLQPLQYEVYVPASPEEEAWIRQRVSEANLESEALGTQPITIIDLRTSTHPCEPDWEATC